MARNAQIVDVLIASPGDAMAGRDAIERALHDWNTHRGDSSGQILRPRRWETGSIPLLGQGDGQSLINQQLVDRADIVFAIFYNKVGSATPRALSGTVEEIKRSIASGKPVHLYFADMQRPSDADLDQLILLRDLRRELQNEGLYGTFKSEEELQRLVANAIEFDLGRMNHTSHEGYRGGSALAREELSNQDAAATPTPDTASPYQARQFPPTANPISNASTGQPIRKLSEKQKLWLLTIMSIAGVIVLVQIGPKPPEPSPAWIAIPGVLFFVSFLYALAKLAKIKLSELRRGS